MAEMRQRLLNLEQFIAAQNCTAAPPPTEAQTTEPNETYMEDVPFPIHSVDIRPTYTWFALDELKHILQMNNDIFKTAPLSEDERKGIIDNYPPQHGVKYTPPDIVPSAANNMQRHQLKQDAQYKKLQYLTSGILRPLDLLSLEIFNNAKLESTDSDRYLYMLSDCRSLILNLSTQINHLRNSLAIKAANPRFNADCCTYN